MKLHIDELQLDSLPFDQRERVAAALESELRRLLSETAAGDGAWSGDRHLPVHEVVVNPLWSAEAIGRHAAESTFQQITGNGMSD